MSLASKTRAGLFVTLMFVVPASPSLGQSPAKPAAAAAGQTIRVVGVVRDESNAITLPGVPVEVVGSSEVVYTDVDGRYVLQLAPGTHQLRVLMEGYQEKLINVTTGPERVVNLDVGLSMSRFTETVTVTAQAVDVETSSAEAQLIERKNSQVITDNLGAQDMKANGDSDAAAAMSRVTGLSVVDNQYVFVRGLGERYSNTTLGGSVIPTTEPDKKVVALDLFPTGLLDSVRVAKSYSPDRSAEFAGGLVEVTPLKLPTMPVVDLSFGTSFSSTATGKSVPFSPLDGHDFWGFDSGARDLPGGFPSGKVVRRGLYTDVGYSPEEITQFGRLLDNSAYRPVAEDGVPNTNWSVTFGNRRSKFGAIASLNQSYKESYVEENRKFFPGADLVPVSDYDFQIGTQKAQFGAVGNVAYQFTPGQRIASENFYSHSGRDEGRIFQGDNNDAVLEFRDYRLQYIEEALFSNGLIGEHFFGGASRSLIDWRVQSARADRNEPDLREVLYQRNQNSTGAFLLADESQSGFRMYNRLNDDTWEGALNWSLYSSANGLPIQLKFGPSHIKRTRDFTSRRFRYTPTNLVSTLDLTKSPEELYTDANIGSAFRLLDTTRPTDAYDAEQTTTAFYGMTDWATSTRTRLVAGVRVEKFKEEVNSFDPFGLFVAKVQAKIDDTDVFPAANFVIATRPNQNLRISASQTVNRPEFRELAQFEFTDVIGNRAIRGNPNLTRALIQNFDVRYEAFSGARGVLAASVFYKHFSDPIERVINAGAEPLATFENADSARNVGIELEASRQLGEWVFVGANYAYVDSEITLTESAIRVQTSKVRPLAGQSKNLFNLTAEVGRGGFTARALVNFAGDRISDVGAGGAPDVIESGRGSLDLVFSQRFASGINVRVMLDNLTDSDFRFTQGDKDQRLYRLGRIIGVSFGYSFF